MSAIFFVSAGVRRSAVRRHCQLPSGVPGVLIRASAPRFSQSCIWATNSLATLQVSDEAVIDHDALSLVFAKALCLKHVNVVDQLLQQQRRGQRLHLHKLFDG